MTTSTMRLKILSSRGEIYDGLVRSVSSKNSAGNFDILPFHANFVTHLSNQPIRVVAESGEKVVFNFPSGIIHANNNEVAIFVQENEEAKSILGG